MKKVIDYLKGLMSDETNYPSAKRYFALAGFIVSVILAFMSKDVSVIIAFLGFVGTCLGLTTADKFSK